MDRFVSFLAAIASGMGMVFFLGLASQAASGVATNPMTGELQRSSPETGATGCLIIAGLFFLVMLYSFAQVGKSNG